MDGIAGICARSFGVDGDSSDGEVGSLTPLVVAGMGVLAGR